MISVTSHVAGAEMRQMIDLVDSGDIPAARKIHQRLIPLYDALFVTTSPIPVKAAMGLVGHPVGPPRLPLVPATDEEIGTIKAALGASGVL